jgi:hypothetical protein
MAEKQTDMSGGQRRAGGAAGGADTINARGANRTAAVNTRRAEKRLAEEQQVVDLMIRLYCKGAGHHEGGGTAGGRSDGGWDGADAAAGRGHKIPGLCPACQRLRDYTAERNARCPFIQTRSFCQFCKVHCYRPEMRQSIIAVMRYSGPRILFYRPILAIKHLLQLRKHLRQSRSA